MYMYMYNIKLYVKNSVNIMKFTIDVIVELY